jgi:hypothetical protein
MVEAHSDGMRDRFGDRAYPAEELVAELCVALLRQAAADYLRGLAPG